MILCVYNCLLFFIALVDPQWKYIMNFVLYLTGILFELLHISLPFRLNDLILFLGLLNLCQLALGNETFIDNKLIRFFNRFGTLIAVFVLTDNVLFIIVILYEAFRKLLELPIGNSLLEPQVKSVDRFSTNETFKKCADFNMCAFAFLLGNIKLSFLLLEIFIKFFYLYSS